MHPKFFFALVCYAFVSTAALIAADDLLITEFMAANTRTLADEDGDFEDWIEIYNAGTNTVNLNGWYLADGGGRWRFPQTNLAPNSFLIVFASNKDRRTPGREFHTDFRLSGNGEYLALLKPDGVTVVSAYTPKYPIQAPDISYGLPVIQTPVTLIGSGAPARMLVPPDDSLATTWTQPVFNDAAWTAVNNGIGFETGAPSIFAPVLLADSVAEFSGTQGGNNWFYGFWDKTSDGDSLYNPTNEFARFPRGTGNTLNSTNNWDGSKWDWAGASNLPPFLELTGTGGSPSGDNGNPSLTNHWAIRRWICETNGPLRITGTLACGSLEGTCGDGIIARILVDGTEVFQRAAFGTSIGYSIIVNANVGSLIDFVIDSGSANNDLCDATTFTAAIRTAGESAVVADSFADWSDSGVQGVGGWSYGYWVKTNTSATYTSPQFKPFPSGTGPHSSANFWDGAQWRWFDGEPPYDTLGQLVSRPSVSPSGGTNALEHWVIRRWVSEITGSVTIDWHFSKKDLTGQGTTAKVFHNGTQIDTITVTGSDFAGTNKTVAPFFVQEGDVIDFTVEPSPGTPANFSIGDIAFLNATISGSTTLSNQFASNVSAAMLNVNATAYLRIPFTVTNLLGVDTLTLRMKYDDGVIVYLNGSPVATRNAPETPVGNSFATSPRLDAQASQFEEVSLTGVRELLRVGSNVLALHGLNSSAADGDFLAVAELRATVVTIDTSTRNYFVGSTPGSLNGMGTTNLGPLVLNVEHTPHDPADNENLIVTARVAPTFNPVGTVRLYYRVQFASESNVVMFDDGLHGDGPAGDGTYGATISSTISTAGQMVRYYVTATDSLSNVMRAPAFPHPTFSAQYFGAVVQNTALTNPLPVLHLFITEASLASARDDSVGRYPASLYYLGEFYDNVGINRHGQSSAGFPKRSFDIDFNPDHHFLWQSGQSRVDDINLLTTYPDKSHMRNVLAYDTMRDAGSPYHYVVPIRVQTNGGFYGDWHIVENGDSDYLKRIGRDPNGALYKMYNTFTDRATDVLISSSEAEKKTRKWDGNADLVALFEGVNHASVAVRTNYMYDNINIAEVLNTMAARTVTSEHDCCHKNYYLYRDSDGTGEWEAMPWDLDLSFGRNWQSAETYWDDRVYTQNRIFGNWDNNAFFQVVMNQPVGRGIDATRQMYFRRVRTLMDQIQQTNGTPTELLRYEKRMDEMMAVLAPDAALDLAKWGSWGGGAVNIFATNSPFWRTLPQSVAELKTNYMPGRRTWVFTQKMGYPAEFPDAQPTNVVIRIGALDYNPASGNQAEEYLQLINTNTIAVDISGWTLSGGIEHTFQGGVVIPRNSSVYVVPDKKAFRSRTTGPKGGMGLYIEGPYKGQLSARGETITLADSGGRIVTTNAYIGAPSGAQQYLRITEIMYAPSDPGTGSPYVREDFEYLELKNIGPVAIHLNGVHFTNGIDFVFSTANTTNLNAGQTIILAKNPAAFAARYPAVSVPVFAYSGSLDNSGENLRLDDAVGEKILDFAYNNSWYPMTEGNGLSLVIVDENAPFYTWDDKVSWRPSSVFNGSPAQTDPAPLTFAGIIVNEVLAHTDPGVLDAIELYNPTTNAVDIGNWRISDDFFAPAKYRIPAPTILPPGGYVVFTEAHFNAGGPTSFSFSSQGDEAYLFSGDASGNPNGFFHGFEFGGSENGVSFGRYTNSQGEIHFIAQSSNTFGFPNGLPKVGPVIISEIMYHPPDVNGQDNSIDEFIELQNITGSSVPLYDPAFPTNRWKLDDAVEFVFSSNDVIPASGFLIVVSFDPVTNAPALARFRTLYNVPTNVAIVGPYSGKLDNNGGDTNGAGESVRLYKPDSPETNGVPSVLVERIDYSDATPWNGGADGFGPSLQRKVVAAYGNDATNWSA